MKKKAKQHRIMIKSEMKSILPLTEHNVRILISYG